MAGITAINGRSGAIRVIAVVIALACPLVTAYRGTVPIFPDAAAERRAAAEAASKDSSSLSYERPAVFAPRPVISAKRLSKTYESHKLIFKEEPVKALVDVTADIEGPGAVALVGDAKAGKTTFMKCLAGLEVPTSGDITVNALRRAVYIGRDTARESTGKSVRRLVRDTVKANLPGEGIGANVDFVTDHIMGIMGLHKIARTPDRELSGGEKYRFSVAMALAEGCSSPTPPLLLLDGFFDKTDSRVRHGVEWTLFDLQRATGVMIVFTAHSHQVVMEMAKLVCELTAGRITEVSTHERSRYARVMFERMRMDVDAKAAKWKHQQQRRTYF